MPDFDAKLEAPGARTAGAPVHIHAHRADDMPPRCASAGSSACAWWWSTAPRAPSFPSCWLGENIGHHRPRPHRPQQTGAKRNSTTIENPAFCPELGGAGGHLYRDPEIPSSTCPSAPLSRSGPELDEAEALAAITINPAVIAGLKARAPLGRGYATPTWWSPAATP